MLLLLLSVENLSDVSTLQMPEIKEQSNLISTDRNFRGSLLKTVTLVRIFNTKMNTLNFKRECMRICMRPRRKDINTLPTQNSHTFLVNYCVFRNITSATVLSAKFPNFGYLLLLTCYFHLLAFTEC